MSTITPPNPRPPMPTRPGVAGPPRPWAAPSAGLTSGIDPIRVLRRHMLTIILAFLVGSGIGVGAFFLLDRYMPLFSAEAIFEVQPGVRDSRDIGANEIKSDQLAMRMANSESMLLLNREILMMAIGNPNIRATEWHRQFIQSDGTFSDLEAVDELEKTLRAGVVRGTNFFRLSWRTGRAADVPVVINAVSDAYMARRKAIDDAVWNANNMVFDRELTRSTIELQTIENDIANFIRSKGLTAIDSARHHPVAIAAEQITHQIAALATTLNSTETALSQTSAKLIGTIEPTPEDRLAAEMDPTVAGQIRQIADLNTTLRHLRERLSHRHPDIVTLEGRLRAAEAEREDRIQEVMKRNLEARAKQLANERDRYQNMLDELQREAELKDETMRELVANFAQYHTLESRRASLAIRRDGNQQLLNEIALIRARADAARVRQVQRATEPRVKSFPQAKIIIPLGSLLITALVVGIIFLRELTDQRIKSASDIAVLPNARVMGVIPDLEEDPTPFTGKRNSAELIVRHHPRSVLAESFRQACSQIMRGMERNGHQTLLLMGGLPGAGSTTTVSNLACSLSAAGKSVLVVDANFRRPRLADACGVNPDALGLGDLLVGTIETDRAIQKSPPADTDAVGAAASFSVIGAGTPSSRVFERLNNGCFDTIIAGLRGKFDVILFDAPPAVVAGDALVLANRVDAAVLVVRANQEQRGLVARVLHQLTDAKCESLGVLLNRARGTAGGYFRKNFATMAEYAQD